MIPLLDTDYPDSAWKHWVSARAFYTPDIARLQENVCWWLFIADDCRPQRKNYERVYRPGCSIEYPTAFTMQGFNYFYHRPTGRPIPIHADDDDGLFPRAKIKGELHLVTPSVLIDLDIYRQNGVLFRRKRVKILIPYYEVNMNQWIDATGKPLPKALQNYHNKVSPEKIFILDAWMYVGKKSAYEPKLDDGYEYLQCPVFFPNVEKPWLTRYYEYTRTFEERQRSCLEG
jgi:hypothetical protein